MSQFDHSLKKRKDSLETRAVLLIFLLELEISWVVNTETTSKQQKMALFSEQFPSKNDFVAVLATFYCYDYGINTSKAVDRIAIDQKDYQKCFLCVIVCCIAKNIINNSKKGWLLGQLRFS